jgi:hypothetical protein
MDTMEGRIQQSIMRPPVELETPALTIIAPTARKPIAVGAESPGSE